MNVWELSPSLSHVRQSQDYFKRTGAVKNNGPWNDWVLAKAFTHSGMLTVDYIKKTEPGTFPHWLRLYLREMTLVISEAAARLKQWDPLINTRCLLLHTRILSPGLNCEKNDHAAGKL